jgi:hypothetical protein
MNKRRILIKSAALIAAASVVKPSSVFAIGKKYMPDDIIIGHGNYKYKVNKEWAQISIERNPLLNCHEMVMDSKGRLLMLGDHTNNNILVFDKSGKLLDYWGTQYPGGHGLTISKEGGEDFLFLTDCGWFIDRNGKWQKQAGQVFKTDINGRLLFNLGDPHTIGAYKDEELFMPTETAIGPNGDIYVADGYGSDYILQYDHKGKFIRKFGGKNNADKNYDLNNAHGITVDYRDKTKPVLVVTSRVDHCFKYFTLDGKYIKTLEMPGLFVCRPVIDDKNLYAGVCWSVTKEGKGWVKDTGFVTITEGDKVVSNPGGTAPEYINGKLQPMFQAENKVFNHGHDVCVDEDKNLYVCQWNASHTAPVKLERV